MIVYHGCHYFIRCHNFQSILQCTVIDRLFGESPSRLFARIQERPIMLHITLIDVKGNEPMMIKLSHTHLLSYVLTVTCNFCAIFFPQVVACSAMFVFPVICSHEVDGVFRSKW